MAAVYDSAGKGIYWPRWTQTYCTWSHCFLQAFMQFLRLSLC